MFIKHVHFSDLYAQLFLLTGVTGRSLKRKKLQFNISENDPFELNGTLSFDVTPSQLENVTLLIILYMKVVTHFIIRVYSKAFVPPFRRDTQTAILFVLIVA